MQTDRFNRLRKDALNNVFSKANISTTWRKIVKDQLRGLDIRDIYDYYDFNYNIDDRALTLRGEILNGTYKVSSPLIYKVEKKFGVCRHIIIPQPTDALILQIITESIADQIIERRPSKNAYYSRDKHQVQLPHEIHEYGLHWRQLWKKFQKKIYKFNETKELLITTDLTNYYDSIDINELKKCFLLLTNSNEVLVDLLFRIVEEISWKPDYLPYSNRGLPTTNIEGIRLLAFSFLFEMDEVIRQRTKDSFVRWLDDITIGVNTKKEAYETISAISDMLKSRGLALNLSKTAVYNKNEAFYHFQIEENQFIDTIEQIKNSKLAVKEIEKKFKVHLKDKAPRYWEKVTKRYITAFGKHKALQLIKYIPKLYIDSPGLRPNLLTYLLNIGYTTKTSVVVESILDEIAIFDDISLYQICNMLTSWNIPCNAEGDAFVEKIDGKLESISASRKTYFDFYCLVCFKLKYSHPEDLYKFIIKYTNLWQADTFLRRQVTAALARIYMYNQDKVERLLKTQIASGVPNTVSVANQILQFAEIDKFEEKIKMYLFPDKSPTQYPFYKFIVLCSLLNSEKIRTNERVKELIRLKVNDNYYRKWIEYQYNIK